MSIAGVLGIWREDQLAEGKLLEGSLRAQGSLKLATDERILRWKPLLNL